MHRLGSLPRTRRAGFVAIVDAHVVGHAMLRVGDQLDFERLAGRQSRGRLAKRHAVEPRPGVVAQRPRPIAPGRSAHSSGDAASEPVATSATARRRRQRTARSVGAVEHLRKVQTLDLRRRFQNHRPAQRRGAGLRVGFGLFEKLHRCWPADPSAPGKRRSMRWAICTSPSRRPRPAQPESIARPKPPPGQHRQAAHQPDAVILKADPVVGQRRAARYRTGDQHAKVQPTAYRTSSRRAPGSHLRSIFLFQRMSHAYSRRRLPCAPPLVARVRMCHPRAAATSPLL